jgi:DNA-binding transcriptional LysR family regulator
VPYFIRAKPITELLRTCGPRTRQKAIVEAFELDASPSCRATSLTTLVQMAASGNYVTLVPTLAVLVENRRRTLYTRPFAPKAPGRTLALVYRRHTALENTLRAVGGVLHEAYVKLPGVEE